MVAASSVVVRLPRSVAEAIEKEARKAGLGLEEFVLELVLQSLDPKDRVREYVEVAEELLEEAKGELSKGDVRQAAEKVWGAAALTVKAYAEHREGRRLVSHGELWEYARKIVKELGPWVREAWYASHAMHTCFYEGLCIKEDVEEAFK